MRHVSPATAKQKRMRIYVDWRRRFQEEYAKIIEGVPKYERENDDLANGNINIHQHRHGGVTSGD